MWSGDSLTVLLFLIGAAIAFGIGAVTVPYGWRSRSLWVGAAAFLLLAFAWLIAPAASPMVALIRPFVIGATESNALAMILVVGVVALVVGKRPRSMVSIGAGSNGPRDPSSAGAVEFEIPDELEKLPRKIGDVEECIRSVLERVENLEKDEPADKQSFADLAAALNAIVRPQLAAARLRELKSIELPHAGRGQIVVDDDGTKRFGDGGEFGRAIQVLQGLPNHLCEIAADGNAKRVEELKGDLDQQFSQAEARVVGNAKYLSLPEEEKDTWPRPEDKQMWHVIEAKLDVLRNFRDRIVRELEAEASPDRGLVLAKEALDRLEK